MPYHYRIKSFAISALAQCDKGSIPNIEKNLNLDIGFKEGHSSRKNKRFDDDIFPFLEVPKTNTYTNPIAKVLCAVLVYIKLGFESPFLFIILEPS